MIAADPGNRSRKVRSLDATSGREDPESSVREANRDAPPTPRLVPVASATLFLFLFAYDTTDAGEKQDRSEASHKKVKTGFGLF